MAKLHELLAAEKTPNAAWNELYEETLKKFKNTSTYFDGHSKSLAMTEDNSANKVAEAQAREEKPVTTTVFETLEYALDLYGKAEDLQFQKNKTNQSAMGTVMWKGSPLLTDMPVDQLLGLEARLTKIRALFLAMPTLDASKHWQPAENIGKYIWEIKFPEETSKTKKVMTAVVMAPATKEHPAQVQAVGEDVNVGKFTTVKRSGAATALQKAEAIKQVDELLVEVKQARMRANETPVVTGKVSRVLLDLLLQPLTSYGS